MIRDGKESMLRKALITILLTGVALINTGSSPAAAVIINPCMQDMGQGATINPAATLTSDTGDEVREEFHQTYPLSPTGRVSLENINGGVQIKVWDRAAVQVDAVKRAYRKERLTEARIDVNSTEENIRIKT